MVPGGALSAAWTEIEIQLALFGWLESRGRILIAPNLEPPKWRECDIFSLTQALYFHEIEIKITHGDYRADFKKRWKHRALSGEPTWGQRMPRTFCYACPRGLLISAEMPSYAGLLWVNRCEPSWANKWTGYRIEIVKAPPTLKGLKLTPEQVEKTTKKIWYKYARLWKQMAKLKIDKNKRRE